MTEETILDIMRTIAIILGLINIGVIARYIQVRKDRKDADAVTVAVPHWTGYGWILFVAALVLEIVDRYREPINTTTPIATAAFIISIAGLSRAVNRK